MSLSTLAGRPDIAYQGVDFSNFARLAAPQAESETSISKRPLTVWLTHVADYHAAVEKLLKPPRIVRRQISVYPGALDGRWNLS